MLHTLDIGVFGNDFVHIIATEKFRTENSKQLKFWIWSLTENQQISKLSHPLDVCVPTNEPSCSSDNQLIYWVLRAHRQRKTKAASLLAWLHTQISRHSNAKFSYYMLEAPPAKFCFLALFLSRNIVRLQTEPGNSRESGVDLKQSAFLNKPCLLQPTLCDLF